MSEHEAAIEEMKENINTLKSANIVDAVDFEDYESEPEESEYTPSQLKAMEKGWNPDPESMPEGKDWVDADEFLRNEKFFAEIRKLKRENQNTRKAFDELQEHHRKVAEVERKKLMEQLKVQKKRALDEADHDTVIEIDEQIAELKAEETSTPNDTNSTANEYQEAFKEWVVDNQWYETDPDMRATADDLGAAYYQRTGGKASPQEVFDYVEQRIKKIFPSNPKPAATKRSPTVEGASASRGRASGGGKRKFTAKDLSADQRKVMNTFVKSGALTAEQYIDELVKIGELS